MIIKIVIAAYCNLIGILIHYFNLLFNFGDKLCATKNFDFLVASFWFLKVRTCVDLIFAIAC